MITSDLKYPAPVVDGIGLLMRGAKRLAISVWLKSVHDARLSVDDFDVIEQKQLKWDGSTWVEHEEKL